MATCSALTTWTAVRTIASYKGWKCACWRNTTSVAYSTCMKTPVHAVAEVSVQWTKALCPRIEMRCSPLGIEAVGEALGLDRIGDTQKGVVGHGRRRCRLRQLTRQPAVAVEVDLQAKRRPGRHAHVAQAELRVDEVEVVVQALAAVGLEASCRSTLSCQGR
jgi:hypothetical protein